jgi:hypothetical protein
LAPILIPTMPPCPRARREPRRDRLDARAVEAEPVDHRLVGIEAKQARPRIARLRLRRHAAGFDEAESEPQQRIHHFGVLVETGRKADRVGKSQAEGRDSELLVIRRRTPQWRQPERLQRQRMRLFRVERAQQRRRKAVEQPDHGSSSGKTCPFAPSGSGLTQRTAESGKVP